MSELEFFIGRVLPFVTLVVFVVGIVTRIRCWLRGAGTKMTLFPAVKAKSDLFKEIAKEVLLFRSLFRGNSSLWVGS